METNFAFQSWRPQSVGRALAMASLAACLCTATGAFAQGEPPVAEEPPPPENPIPPAYTQTDGQPPPPGQGQGPPPPGYGPPPPGYGPPADPYNYGVPPGTPVHPSAYDDWEEGEPIPPGFRTDTRIRKGLVIGGAVTMGSLWVISVIAAGFAVSIEDVDAIDGVEGSVTAEDWYPLFVPVAGPFITVGTVGSEGLGTALLLIDGIAQTGGLVMLILGATLQETYLRPAPQYGDLTVEFAPVVAPGFSGMGMKGTF